LLHVRIGRQYLAWLEGWALHHLAPLRVVELPQLELWGSVGGAVELRMGVHRPQPPAAPLRPIGILSKQRLLVGEVEPPIVEPNRDALAGQPALGIEIEALYTDVACPIDRPCDLQLA
jgi:hypothetical protein